MTMRFLRKLRLHSRGKNAGKESKVKQTGKISHHYASPPAPRYDLTTRLPRKILARIFAQVCPHTLDHSYRSSEESMTEDGCMLCDMRDLAHCVLVCKHWLLEARALLYRNIRIDPVHYCELEIELAAKRTHRSFFDRNGDPIDAPKMRLELLMRTVRESQELANMILSLRMPYMTREASKAELARTISVLQNLRYVDLPAGVFSDDATSHTLKQELMIRCPQIRRMKYAQGSEGSFGQIPGSRLWMHLEELELSGLQVEDRTLRLVLNSFPRLQSLKVEGLPLLEDSTFSQVRTMPLFPPVQRLVLRNIPGVTATGLATYLSFSQNQAALTHLTLSNTGVMPCTLHRILITAPSLLHLTIIQEVDRSFPQESTPLLSSKSLRSMHYEITSESSSYALQRMSNSYYTYLISSLTSNSLPTLHELYVRDANFPETLLLTPPPRLFGGGESGPQYHSLGFTQPLAIYSKGIDELEWNFTQYEPLATGRRGSVTRPVSFHEAQLSPSWGGETRRSVLVGNGFGGFLAVPVDEGRPKSSGGLRRDSRHDLWR